MNLSNRVWNIFCGVVVLVGGSNFTMWIYPWMFSGETAELIRAINLLGHSVRRRSFVSLELIDGFFFIRKGI